MLAITNTTLAQPVGNPTYGPTVPILMGGPFYVFPWVCTARDNTLSSGVEANILDASSRTATTCYMRGLKERIQIQTNDGHPWQWRRICFTLKGRDLYQFTETSYKLFAETTAGFSRLVNNIRSANMNTELNNLLFKGVDGSDWNNYFNAKTDNRRVTIKYDRTTSIKSGNDFGMMKEYNRWHPMNKNLVYDDDEVGGNTNTSVYSAQGKAGMGDYYIVDIIAAGTGATADQQMTFNPSATLYWHER